MVGDPVGVIDLQPLDIGGDAALADAFGDRRAFGLQFAVDIVVPQRCTHRVGQSDPDILVALAQRHRYAAQRSAGADGADKSVQFAAGLFPDLGSGRAVMGVAIGEIVELVGPDGAVRFLFGKFRRQPARHLYIVVRILVGHDRNLDQICAAQAQHVFFLLGLGIRNHDDRPVAAGIADQGEADARVAGGAFHDRAAGLQGAGPFGVFDNGERGPVLHRLAGIEKFGLAEDGAAGRLGRAFQLDERGVADGADKAVPDGHRRGPHPRVEQWRNLGICAEPINLSRPCAGAPGSGTAIAGRRR